MDSKKWLDEHLFWGGAINGFSKKQKKSLRKRIEEKLNEEIDKRLKRDNDAKEKKYE